MLEAHETLAGVDMEELATMLEAGTLIRLHEEGGRVRLATGLRLVKAPERILWQCAGNIEGFPDLIKMVDRVRHLRPSPEGLEVVQVDLRFKITFFSTKFAFVATRVQEGRSVKLDYYGGKIKDVDIQVETAEVDEQRSVLRCRVGFDPRSLGWLVKVFLRHHPEIEGGLHAGAMMAIASATAEEAERRTLRGY